MLPMHWGKVTATTGDLKRNYEILGIVSARIEGDMDDKDTQYEVDKLIDALKLKCDEEGGNAVINCVFVPVIDRDADGPTLHHFAYGTAVKFT